jgi:hypothetical protein
MEKPEAFLRGRDWAMKKAPDLGMLEGVVSEGAIPED